MELCAFIGFVVIVFLATLIETVNELRDTVDRIEEWCSADEDLPDGEAKIENGEK